MKSIVRGDKGLRLAKKLYAIEAIKPGLHKCFIRQLDNEGQTLCKIKTNSVLRNTSGNNLETLSFKTITAEMQIFAPLLLDVLSAVMNNPSNSRLAVTAAILLKNRNIHMSAVHHVVSHILDHGGATDEVKLQLYSILVYLKIFYVIHFLGGLSE